ncbi:MAG TPA: MG2 domain-containing protein [Pyrinomonadaceae bacterium]|nr:MG2 domain-containing protein [Pyrinomonadaceae bacterium]
MRRRWLSLLLCLQVCLCALAVSSLALAQSPSAVRVNEAATRILLGEGHSKIALAVENYDDRPVLAHITLELLDPRDKVVARTQRRETLQPRASVVAAFLPVSNLARAGEDRRQLLWYRLRYEIAPSVADALRLVDSPPSKGIISLSEITPDLFELRVSAASRADAGQLYRVRVRATHPLTSRPVGGVAIAAAIEFDAPEAEQDNVVLKLSGTTNAEGYATLDFKLPPRIADDDGELTVTGRRGDVVERAWDDIDFSRTTRILLTSDKPLYQPGQILRLRALLLNHTTRRALAEAQATLKIEDPEGTTVFTAPLKTSRFGIASCDWPIPDGTRLGDYNVRVAPDDDDSDDGEAHLRVKISRYELPNFSVVATPDRGYYLPGESAGVEVRGEYLFGQPLKRGHVRIVRETEREWNYREQKYDIREGDKYEGELAADGRFLARINLTKEHAELAGNSWTRFADLSFAAYVTDPTTNRTEQRRFRLRLTREPIHIYVTQGNYRPVAGLPLAFFVSTSYADGTPASCEVKIAHTSARRESERAARTFQTNAYGIIKVVGSELSEEELSDHRISILFSAHDREGRAGTHAESIWTYSDSDEPVIRVETDKTIYRAGEPIAARITSNKEDMKIFLDVVSNNRVVATETLRLRGRRGALLELPYRPEFQSRVTLSAYATDFPENRYDDDHARGTRTVIYPRNRELKFDVRMSRASYQPGEEAAAGVRVRDASGRSRESALGVVVFDKAVEERARTEQEFGASYGFSDYFYQFWYGAEAIGGVSARDIEQLDAARTLPEGLETVADLLLQRDEELYRPNFFGSSNYDTNQSRVFDALVSVHLGAANNALKTIYAARAEHPADEPSLRRLLAAASLTLEDLRDPWGTPYRPVFAVERVEDVLIFKSAGADKKFDTGDDWTAAHHAWPYFRPAGEAINRLVIDYHKRTGNFIRDFNTLKTELLRAGGLDLESLRDRWGKPYSFDFGVSGTNYTISIVSGGADGRLVSTETHPHSTADNFAVWTTWTDYFAGTRAQVEAALDAYLKATGSYPRDEAAMREALRREQLDLTQLRDPWQRPYYPTFRNESRYVDRVRIEGGGNAGSQAAQRTQTTLVTRQLEFVTLRSAGADGQAGTPDDFSVAEFSRIVSDQTAQDAKPQPAPVVTTFSGATGAISGTVIDPSGAVVPNAAVTATHQQQNEVVFETTTDGEGKFLLRNLPSGLYAVHVDAPGFTRASVTDVQVQSSTLATLNFNLTVGNVSETVTINSTDNKIQTNFSIQSAALLPKGSNFSSLLKMKDGAQPAPRPPVQTPRLRKDFPETLYWQPAVETDRQGRTDIRFKLADNITTWKMSIIGSTETGELGTTEHEIRAFQPFFVEHDPPRVLTEGDEINLPVVLRNYLERAQTVALDIKPEDWFTLLSPARKQAQVAAGDSSRETFDFRAIASVREGVQRITAIGADASDQIEKPIHVHPDGEEVAATATQILAGSSVLEVNLPDTAIPRTARSELKIYPNLMAHAIEGVEAIMSRPYGCGEQTISSTYPSLLVLRHYTRAASDDDAKLPPVASKAARYVREGYERLLSYRSDAGGFSYWGRGEPDLALTAYAVRFLTDAREFINVDESVLTSARDWLVRQQSADGSWAAYEYEKTSNARRTAMLTAYVARILAMQKPDARVQTSVQTTTQAAPQAATQPATPLRRALAYLAPRVEEFDEPYLIASYVLAAIDGGESREKIERATRKLLALAREDAGGGAYWALDTNTPFYGWGQAGRIETTALAVQALARAKAVNGGAQVEGATTKDEKKADSTAHPSSLRPHLSVDELVNRGLLYLLMSKDRYGVWLSTQATVNVLDALNVLSPTHAPDAQGNKDAASGVAADAGAAQKVEVFVNGQSAGTVSLPAAHEPSNPVSLDLSRFVSPGANRVEIKHAQGAQAVAATAQLVTTYYRAWSAAAADGTLVARPQEAHALRLAVNFDRTTAATNDTITCRVEAERVGGRGYGMLLAEIGLPPGADVDRGSLERAMKESGWEFSHYDVLPDRLVVYLWPRAGGTKFAFTFRPRFGLSAKSAPSVVYDYYNPEARAVLAPTKFVVSEKPVTSPAQAGRE